VGGDGIDRPNQAGGEAAGQIERESHEEAQQQKALPPQVFEDLGVGGQGNSDLQ
jgi:hypothetical protein